MQTRACIRFALLLLVLLPASFAAAAAKPAANAAPLYLAAMKQAARWQSNQADPSLAKSVMHMVEQANALPHCDWPADALSQHTPVGSFNLGSPPPGLIEVLSIYSQTIKKEMAGHHWAAAWQHIRSGLTCADRLRRAAGAGGGVSNLLSILNADQGILLEAQDCLADSGPPPALIPAYRQLLAPTSLWQDTARAILHDCDAVSNADQDGSLRKLMFYTDQPESFPSDDDLQQSLDLMKQAARLAKKGDYKNDLTADSDQTGISMTQTVLSALNMMASSVRNQAQEQQAILLAIDIQQYQIKHHTWPKTLADVAGTGGGAGKKGDGFTCKVQGAVARLSWQGQTITIAAPKLSSHQ